MTTTEPAKTPDEFYASLTRRRFESLATVNRRGTVFRVSVRHDVGFGGSRVFKVRGVASTGAALDAVWRDLKGTA